MPHFALISTAKSQLGDAEPLLYDADSDGSTLLHMAVDSGITEVSNKVIHPLLPTLYRL